ncbi:hypothetical protein [Bacillus wiedmannii]|uniref:hypothetical protein n=2 Tax=Bacillus wiedmannii TaxID=1890302 RepID=UPI00197AD316|nr:hypothetical protein [Bacillus wiedmannii]
MIASIKMPVDTFQPSAGVQTSIYVFEAGKPHNFEMDTVKFIDFRNDGYKRTLRGNYEIDHPTERYQDIVKIFRLGKNASKNKEFHNELWEFDDIYIEDLINDSGEDWNFEKHQIIDTAPTEEDFISVIGEYLSFEVSQLLKERDK